MFEVVKNALAVKVPAAAPELSTQEDCARRAEELFQEQRQEIFRNTDQLFARLMIVQWIASIVMAVVISPYTWAGQSSAIHIHVWAAIFLGGAISAFPIWLTRVWPGAALTRHVMAVAQMLMSALLISVTGGRIETHFHVFGSLVILSFYRDWRVLVPATIVVALDHFLRGVYWPYSVYGVLAASPWRSVEHAAWVVFEDLFLVISCFRSIREMRSIANRAAALEASEQTFRQIFQDGPMGIAVVDLEQRFVKVNEALCHMMGYSAEELIGKNTLDLTCPEDAQLDQEVIAQLHDGAMRSAFEKRYIRKDGKVLWVNLTAAIIRNEQGEPHHYITMLKDITGRKSAEEELRQLNESLEQRVAERTAELQREIGERIRVQESLLDSEERYRTLFEQNPEPTWVFDCETLRFLEVNRAAIQHYGYSREEFLRMTLSDIRPPNDVPALLENIKSLKTGETATGIWRHQKKDGSIINVSITANEFEWSDRAARLVVAVDVTERKRAQDALHETNLALTNAMPGISILTPEGRYERVNSAYAEMMGYAPEELVGMDWTPTVAKADRQTAVQAYQRMVADGKSEFEARAVRKDGSIFDKHVLMVKRVDATGNHLGHYCFMRDITEEKRAQEALRHAEQKYRSIFENAIEGMFQTTPEGTYISVNPALARMYGYDSPEQLMAVNDIGHVVYVDPERRKEFKRLVEEQGFVELFEYEVFRKDGRKILLCENARAVRDATGKILYYEGTVEDITERKRVEEVERANKAKSEFLSRVSHELRTPLNAILGFGQLLERQKPTEVQRKRIRHIINAGQHLLGLINEVLDISRIETGKMQVSLEPVNVADAIAEGIDLMRPLAAEREIKLSVDTNLDAGVYVLADRQRFKQVLLNLLTNAVKYTPREGKVLVSYHANGSEDLRICVSDTGPGIPAEKLTRLFTPFDRLGAEQSNVEGTGLGLALSKRLMGAMHGSIGVDSHAGKGSTFWLELPRTKSPLENVAAQTRNSASRFIRPDAPHRTVLYIEDNLSNLNLIEQMFEERPEIELISAMLGTLGLQLARQHRPDVILLDLHLPDVAGWEVLRQLKADAATRDIPVIVISADATARQVERLMKGGATTYLTKPLDVAEFFHVFEKVTGPKRQEDQASQQPTDGAKLAEANHE
jgi:PAS domain S-box-containing protein